MTAPVRLPDAIIALQDLLGTTLEHVRSSHPFTEAQIDRDVRFRQLDSATVLHDLAPLPGVRLCLQFGLVAAIYVADGTILSGLDAADLVATLGEPEAEWPARSGAGHTQRVYPEFGLAVAGDRSTVAVLELFPPMSIAEYLAAFKQDPAPEPVR